MQSFIKATLLITVFVALASCGAKSDKSELTQKKVKLEKLKKQEASIAAEIKTLEADIVKLDTSAKKPEEAKLVLLDTVQHENFTHYIDLQGRIDAENISFIAPRGAPAQVKAVYVKQGDIVRKGQLLLKLDDAVIRQQVVTAKQSMAATKNQLELAQNVYQRTKNLWEQHIGTEVQLMKAQTDVDVLGNQLKTQQQSLRTAQEQLATTNVVSDVSGIADIVTVHVGEMFPSATGVIKIVNSDKLKVITDIPENYLARVQKGTPILISVPDVNKTYKSTISVISQSIGSASRSFTAEAKIPSDKSLKPNLSATVRIQDYTVPNAITVPVSTIQTDEKGKFILVAAKEGGKMIARKRQVQVGELYGDRLEVRSGLNEGDIVITEGFQGLYDGQLVTTSTTTAKA